MKPTRLVTAVLLAAAFAAVGCSNRGETSQAKVKSRNAEQSKPVATRGESLPLKRAGEEGSVSPEFPLPNEHGR